MRKSNAIYLEAAGNAVFYSLNYDHTFHIDNHFSVAPRAGFMFLPLKNVKNNNTFSNISIPFELNFLWYLGRDVKDAPELGIGYNFIGMKDGYQSRTDSNYRQSNSTFAKVTTLRLGFRHQKPEGGLMYRLGLLIPIAQDKYSEKRVGDDIFYRIYAGGSIGWSF